MGVEYEFELYFPRQEIWNVLDSVAKMSANQGVKEIELILPDQRMKLPFTSNFKSEPVQFLEADQYLRFDTALLFEPDSFIEEYVAEQEQYFRGRNSYSSAPIVPKDDPRKARIGYIYLYISPQCLGMPKLANLSFLAATSRMGLLFKQSPSIRRTFVELLERHDGVLGHILDSDYNEYPIVIYPANFDAEKFKRTYWEPE